MASTRTYKILSFYFVNDFLNTAALPKDQSLGHSFGLLCYTDNKTIVLVEVY